MCQIMECRLYNNLPEEVARAPSLSAFKARLDSQWAKIGYGHIERPWPNILLRS